MDDTGHGPHLPKPTPLGDPPAVSPPVTPPPPPPPKPINLATDDVPCRNCSFNLRGLSEDGNCPECGSPIWVSVQDDLLIYSGESYLRSLHRGLICILIGALLSITMTLVGIVLGIIVAITIAGGGAAPGTGPNVTIATSNTLNALLQLISLPIALLSLYGWWLFSSPDPGRQFNDTGQTPRRIVRIAVIVLAATNVVITISQFAVMAVPSLALAVGAVSFLGLAAVIAQFFAAMLYIKWLGPRIPDPAVTERAKLYMWLLPLIFVVGSCVIVGPLIAWIMYLLLLNKIRIDIRGVRERVSHGAGRPPGTVPEVPLD